MPPLKNLRHEQFVQLYFADPEKNAERAYANAGFQVKTAKEKSTSASACSVRLLKDARVQKRLAELVDRQIKRLDISADRVLVEMSRIAFSDVRKVVGENGYISDPAEWDDDMACAVAGLETEKLYEGKGKDRTFIGYTQKIKLWDKNTALTNLAKHFKLLTTDEEVKGDTYNFHLYLPHNERDSQRERSKIPIILNGHQDAGTNGNGATS
jgi:phage terminase small subunit